MRRQKVKRKVKSLLEKQSTCGKMHGRTQRERCAFFRVFVFFPAHHLVLSPLANLSKDPPLRCSHTSQPRWISTQRILGEERLIMARRCPLTFDPQGTFLSMCSVSLAPTRAKQRSLDPSLKQGFAPFVLAMTVILSHPQETKLGYLPCLCHCFHFGE